MGSPTFLSSQCADNDSFRDVKKRLKLEGLHEISVEYLSFVLHRDSGSAMGQGCESRDGGRHGVVRSNEA